MRLIISIVLIFTYCAVGLCGCPREATLEDGFIHSGGECTPSGKQNKEAARTANLSYPTEIDIKLGNRCSESLRNNTDLPLEATIITFGTFDILHVGHLNLLHRAKQLGKNLIVGICTDATTQTKKGRFPINSEEQRRDIVEAIRYVDHVFMASKSKRDHILEWKADILVMGNDHKGAYDSLSDICEVVYLPRTSGVSTSEIIKKVSQQQRDDALS